MCVEVSPPDVVPLRVYRGDGGCYVVDFTFLFVKVLARGRDGLHESTGGAHRLAYPLRQHVVDPFAVPGAHGPSIHLATIPSAHSLGSYGGCLVLAFADRRLWPDGRIDTPRCWHTRGLTPLYCATCERVAVEELTMPEFLQKELGLPRLDDYEIEVPGLQPGLPVTLEQLPVDRNSTIWASRAILKRPHPAF
jgi:hypothetical protein